MPFLLWELLGFDGLLKKEGYCFLRDVLCNNFHVLARNSPSCEGKAAFICEHEDKCLWIIVRDCVNLIILWF